MKLQEIAEAYQTTNLTELGIDLTTFSERKMSFSINGHDVYQRTDQQNKILFDIDEVAFIVGIISDRFKGKVKNKVFDGRRAWVDPSARGKGLVTSILFGLFKQQDFALVTDETLSPDGIKLWLRLCDNLPITHVYKIDDKRNVVTEVDLEYLKTNLMLADTRCVIEHPTEFNPINKMGISKPAGKIMVENFDGLS